MINVEWFGDARRGGCFTDNEESRTPRTETSWFNQRLCQALKAKKLAFTASMRNLFPILNAKLASGTPWLVTAGQDA
ncbi:MAG TPA: hypothetical protein VGQ08_13805 [Nitrospiraceae bacterium]|jgi:hypothetical protein|nr:hypothetical protein [Nitrospiraceae bacterium]